jgi:hypothetical protein
MRKKPNVFWRSKFNSDATDLVVEKVSDRAPASTSSQAADLRVKFDEARRHYSGHSIDARNCFDAHIVSKCIFFGFQNGKACGLDQATFPLIISNRVTLVLVWYLVKC